MSEPEDKNVRAVQKLLADRAALGLAKYGVTTERTDFSRLDFMREAQAEMLDGAIYLQRLIADEERAMAPCQHEIVHRDLSGALFCSGCGEPFTPAAASPAPPEI